jgi:hypothetical protein
MRQMAYMPEGHDIDHVETMTAVMVAPAIWQRYKIGHLAHLLARRFALAL